MSSGITNRKSPIRERSRYQLICCKELENHRPVPKFEAIRRDAEACFVALQSRWGCQHSVNNTVHLRLEERLEQQCELPRTSFRFLFRKCHYRSHGDVETSSPWTWEEAVIEPFDGNINEAPGPSTRVDICEALTSTDQSSRADHLSLLTDKRSLQSNGLVGIKIQSNQESVLDTESWRMRSLHTVLRDPDFSVTFKLPARLAIAPALASAVLQLACTSWLREDLTKDNIFIFQGTGDTFLDRAYVSCHIASNTHSAPEMATRETCAGPVRNTTLLALAEVLLELWTGAPLYDSSCEDKHPNIYEKFASVKAAAGASLYMDAVRRCIHCDFDWGQPDLRDIVFQELVHERVVKALTRHLQYSPKSES